MNLTNENFVDEAEKVIISLDKDKYDNIKLTTSKIRNLLSMISNIYNEAIHIEGDKLTEEIISKIQYLRMRFVYEVGRDQKNNSGVKGFYEKAKIKENIAKIKDSKEQCILFCKYFEALVAYHKFYGGKDK